MENFDPLISKFEWDGRYFFSCPASKFGIEGEEEDGTPELKWEKERITSKTG